MFQIEGDTLFGLDHGHLNRRCRGCSNKRFCHQLHQKTRKIPLIAAKPRCEVSSTVQLQQWREWETVSEVDWGLALEIGCQRGCWSVGVRIGSLLLRCLDTLCHQVFGKAFMSSRFFNSPNLASKLKPFAPTRKVSQQWYLPLRACSVSAFYLASETGRASSFTGLGHASVIATLILYSERRWLGNYCGGIGKTGCSSGLRQC
jgi:hypothetical protein